MSNEHLLQQVAIDIAVIKSKMEAFEGHISDEAEARKTIFEKLTKQDITLGKIGVAFSIIVFVVTIAVNFGMDVIKKLFITAN